MTNSNSDNPEDDPANGLSEEDAALWQKVVKTIDNAKTIDKEQKKQKKTNLSSQTDTDTENVAEAVAKNEQTNADIIKKAKQAARTPTSEEFGALLDETLNSANIPPAKIHAQTAAGTTKEQKPQQQQNKPKTTANPRIETFNQRDARNISSGKQTIDAAIDLHGLTQRQAETALKTFLKRAHLDEKRTVLVITGKGQRRDHRERAFELGAPEPGVLRRTVPNWLDDMPDIVVSYTTSHSKHGGEGALYVRLRRLAKKA